MTLDGPLTLDPPAEILLSERAEQLIAEDGGVAYVWSETDGSPRISTQRPWRYGEFAARSAGASTLYIDAQIRPPRKWEIVCSNWRGHTQLQARYNGCPPDSPLGRCHFVSETVTEEPELPSGVLAHMRRFLVWRVPWSVYYWAALAVAPLIGISTHSVRDGAYALLGLLAVVIVLPTSVWDRVRGMPRRRRPD